MNIGNRQIGPNHPPYIIAELGVNHDGSVDRALQLVDAAADAGADAVKLQLFKADLLMSKAAKLAAYQKASGESDPIEMLRRLELSIEQMAPIVEKAHARGIHAIVTVFSVELVEIAESLPWDAYKTASPDIIHKPLLESLMAIGKPMIVSTGAAEFDEIRRACDWLAACRERMALLHCVSSYPTPPDQAHVHMCEHLSIASTPSVPVGYSDHTTTLHAGRVARVFGAVLFEKHLTVSNAAIGPDHAASLNTDQFAQYVRNTHASDEDAKRLGLIDSSLFGDLYKHVLPIEQNVRTVSRQSITTTRNLPAGHRLTRADLTFKRPGTGIPPFRLDEILTRPLTRPVESDMPIAEVDLV